MEWTTQHYFVGDSAGLSAESWDLLRAEHPGYRLAADRDGWIDECNADGVAMLTAARIGDELTLLAESSVFSAGCGRAHLEWHLYRMGFKVSCGDFARRTVARLQLFFTEAEFVSSFDMRSDAWPASVVVLHRVDTEFSDTEWKTIFARLRAESVDTILFVPADFLRLKHWLREKLCVFRQLAGQRVTPAGYLRTKARMYALWRDDYRLAKRFRIGRGWGFVLRSR